MNLELILGAFEITTPILVLLLLGAWFKSRGWINEGFVASGNTLVFNVSLPCFLYLSVASNSIAENVNPELILFGFAATLVTVVITWLLYFKRGGSGQRGVLAQCAYRGNIAIVGLALVERAMGTELLGKAAIYLAFMTILYNLIAVMLLSTFNKKVIVTILKNPLIIALVFGLLSSAINIELPQIVSTSMNYLARLTLPLALLCLGASLQWQNFKKNHKEALVITTIKLVIVPMACVLVAQQFGFAKVDLLILFFMMSAPTAVASYVMANKMTSQGALAGEIVALSTLLSPITIAVGFYLLKVYGVV